jgi:hypothetical protein
MNDNYEALIENEKEWRRYVVKKLDSLERDYNIFKVKAFAFMSVVSFIINFVMKFLTKE